MIPFYALYSARCSFISPPFPLSACMVTLQAVKMMMFACFGKKLEHLCRYSCKNINSCFKPSCRSLFWLLFRFLVSHVNPFFIQLSYFLLFSLLGYLALKLSNPRTSSFRPYKDIDVFFTSVSATTVSSMSTIEMEVFSNTQLIIMTFLMLVGGEVFTSMLGLQIAKSQLSKNHETTQNKTVGTIKYYADDVVRKSPIYDNVHHQIDVEHEIKCLDSNTASDDHSLTYSSIRFLGYVVLGYLFIVHSVGYFSVFLYIILVPSARKVLKNKGLHMQTFSIFTTVSTFTNCGFIPTNENMVVFKKNSGLLLLLISQLLMGNTLYPPCLLFVIWVLKKASKREEFGYILKNYREMGYSHLLPAPHAARLAVTVFGFILMQFMLFCSMEWGSEAMDGLNSYQKLVGSLFQSVNSRHAGESVVDISTISSAILVLFVVMMYLPPYTTFLPTKDHEEISEKGKEGQNRRKTLMESLMLSQLSYLAMFIILICITERHKMKEDPLNFNVLNVTIEVISAYGNVGFTTGYSCKRQVKPDSSCKDTWYGFAGRWSTEGKLILIVVMFFGRLKKFSMKGGKAWKLS